MKFEKEGINLITGHISHIKKQRKNYFPEHHGICTYRWRTLSDLSAKKETSKKIIYGFGESFIPINFIIVKAKENQRMKLSYAIVLDGRG